MGICVKTPQDNYDHTFEEVIVDDSEVAQVKINNRTVWSKPFTYTAALAEDYPDVEFNISFGDTSESDPEGDWEGCTITSSTPETYQGLWGTYFSFSSYCSSLDYLDEEPDCYLVSYVEVTATDKDGETEGHDLDEPQYGYEYDGGLNTSYFDIIPETIDITVYFNKLVYWYDAEIDSSDADWHSIGTINSDDLSQAFVFIPGFEFEYYNSWEDGGNRGYLEVDTEGVVFFNELPFYRNNETINNGLQICFGQDQWYGNTGWVRNKPCFKAWLCIKQSNTSGQYNVMLKTANYYNFYDYDGEEGPQGERYIDGGHGYIKFWKIVNN